jgi:hypothetical protein
MASPVKLIVGSLIGAGLGVAISKFVEQRQEPGLSATASFADDATDDGSTAGSMQDRLTRAKVAGVSARAAKEAELRAFFREKVQRSDALSSAPEA